MAALYAHDARIPNFREVASVREIERPKNVADAQSVEAIACGTIAIALHAAVLCCSLRARMPSQP